MYRTGAGTQADPRELCEPGRDYHGAAEEGRAGRGEVQEFPGALKGPSMYVGQRYLSQTLLAILSTHI